MKIPLFSKVAKDWLDYKKPNVRKSTWRKYESYTKNHFDELKNIKINRITTVKIEKFIIKRQTEGMNLSKLRKLIATLTVYAPLMKSTNQEAASRLENTIFQTNGSKTVAETKTGATV